MSTLFHNTFKEEKLLTIKVTVWATITQHAFQLTSDSEFVQFNEQKPLVPEQHVDTSLIKLGSQEYPHCAHLRAVGAVLSLQPMPQGSPFHEFVTYFWDCTDKPIYNPVPESYKWSPDAGGEWIVQTHCLVEWSQYLAIDLHRPSSRMF